MQKPDRIHRMTTDKILGWTLVLLLVAGEITCMLLDAYNSLTRFLCAED